MKRSAYRCAPNWFGICCAEIASTADLISVVVIAGVKILTLGPKSGAVYCVAAAAPESTSAAVRNATTAITREAIGEPLFSSWLDPEPGVLSPRSRRD